MTLPLVHALEMKLSALWGWRGRSWQSNGKGITLLGYPPGSRDITPIPQWGTNPVEMHKLIDQYELQVIHQIEGYIAVTIERANLDPFGDTFHSMPHFESQGEAVLTKVLDMIKR